VAADLATFDTTFGCRLPRLSTSSRAGTPPFDRHDRLVGWTGEIALDTQWRMLLTGRQDRTHSGEERIREDLTRRVDSRSTITWRCRVMSFR